MFAANATHERGRTRTAPRRITLLDLVSELVDAGGSEGEVSAAVMHLIETGRVRLVGQVCEADLRVHL